MVWSESKDADQPCSYCTADLRLYFRICKLLVFLFSGSAKVCARTKAVKIRLSKMTCPLFFCMIRRLWCWEKIKNCLFCSPQPVSNYTHALLLFPLFLCECSNIFSTESTCLREVKYYVIWTSAVQCRCHLDKTETPK